MINIIKFVSAGLPLVFFIPTAAAAWSPVPYESHESLSGILSEQMEGYPRPEPSGYNGCIWVLRPVTDVHGNVIGFYNVRVCN